ncbi:MAG: glycosyltransferase family 4 protein [Saprospiraceae bacterium]
MYIISLIDKAIAFEWISERLNKKQFALSFILLNNSPSYLAEYLEANNVECQEIEYKGKKSIPSALLKTIAILRKSKPDIVHTHLVDADLIGLTAAWLCRVKKRIYTRHNSNFHKKYHKNASKLEKLNNVLCTDVVAISKNVSDILIHEENINPSKVKLVHHGFDLERFDKVALDDVDHLRYKYDIPKRCFVIGVVARYMHWKGIQHIIPAFKKYQQQNPDVFLVLANAGRGDYSQEIRSQLDTLPEDTFVEIEFEHNLFALYHLFDIFVHVPIDPQVEAFGQIYVEALAAGIPSIFTLSGVAREFIIHEQNALVVDFENEDQIYNAMNRLYGAKQLMADLSIKGKKDVRAFFGLEKMISKLESIYCEE